jgi:lysophospholipase
MPSPAPFFHDIALGPASAYALWAQAADGVRLRIAIWPEVTTPSVKGTILLLPGRTEFVEKYGLAAADLAARGYATVAIDLRCQGASDRLLKNPLTGHVVRFDDYQMDVAVLLKVAHAEALPEPYYLLAHSMGGPIAFRAMANGLPVKAAVLTAPMWGIKMAPHLRPVAWGLCWAAQTFGFSHLFTPGTRKAAYVGIEPFEGNSLTSDPDIYAYMKRQLAAQPQFGLGGPSLQWLYASLRELRLQAREAAPAIPTLTFLGTDEDVVLHAPIHQRMKSWPQGRLDIIQGGRHEVLMETPAIRAEVFDKIAAHFAAYP